MMGDFFWNVATSFPALGALGLVLLAALVVGWFPLLKFVPAIGAYVPVARLVALLAAALLFFLIGFRVSDEREEAKRLRAVIAAQRADIDAARKSAADANQRATSIEKDADAQRKQDDDYVSTLKLAAGCGFEPFPGRLRDNAGPAAAAAAGARSAAGAGSADEGAPGAGAGSDVPVPVVRHRWLPWQRP